MHYMITNLRNGKYAIGYATDPRKDALRHIVRLFNGEHICEAFQAAFDNGELTMFELIDDENAQCLLKNADMLYFFADYGYWGGGKAIICDGVHYNSVSAASRMLNMSQTSIKHRIKSPNFDYSYV